VKPGNLLREGDHKLLLCDFGSAALMSSSGHTAAIRATPQYQPPEAAGQGWMCAASDTYSLGLTAIEMLDGHFLWKNQDIFRITARIDSGRRGYAAAALASAARPPHAPAPLRTLLAQCVAADPSKRPTAAQLARTLESMKVVDWRHVDGKELDGRWIGSWPNRARSDRVVALELESSLVPRGQHAGARRLSCRYSTARSNGWRSIGSELSPTYVGAQDAAAVSRFFKTVSDKVAQRFPA
jgi:serine/threonine protein kinase